MRSVLTLLILTLNLLNILRANEDISKKTKVLACIALSKARIAQDSGSIAKMVEKINKQLGTNEGKNKILSLSLVNCYSSISNEKAVEVIEHMHNNNEINAMSQEHKAILGLEDVQKSQRINTAEFNQEFNEINSILRELGREQEQIKGKTPDLGNKGKFSFLGSFIDGLTILAHLGSFFLIDGTIGIALLILGSFFCLKFLNDACMKKRKVKESKQKTY